MYLTGPSKATTSCIIQSGHSTLIRIWSDSLLKAKSKYGIMKVLVKTTRTMKSAHFNQQESMKPTNTILSTFPLKKSKWSETLSTWLRTDAKRDFSQKILGAESDKISDFHRQEESFNRNWSSLKEWESTEWTCGETSLSLKSLDSEDKLWPKLAWHTVLRSPSIKQHRYCNRAQWQSNRPNSRAILSLHHNLQKTLTPSASKRAVKHDLILIDA